MVFIKPSMEPFMFSLAAMSGSLYFFRFFLFPKQINYVMNMKVIASETICPFSSQWLSKAFKLVQKLGRELTFCGALEDTSARHADRPNQPELENLPPSFSSILNLLEA